MTQRDFLLEVLKGNGEAVRLVEDLGMVSQAWDDLVDGDKPMVMEAINRAFWTALVEVPANAFYQRHFQELQPLIKEYAASWLTANDLEKGDRHSCSLAFVLRDGLVGLVVQCAYLVGGYEWMREQAARIRQFFHDETLQRYLEGLP